MYGWCAPIGANPTHWCIEIEGRRIGAAHLHSLDEANCRAGYAVGIYDRQLDGQGLAYQATRLVLERALDVLHLHRVAPRVLSFNKWSIRCPESCGFVRIDIEHEDPEASRRGLVKYAHP